MTEDRKRSEPEPEDEFNLDALDDLENGTFAVEDASGDAPAEPSEGLPLSAQDTTDSIVTALVNKGNFDILLTTSSLRATDFVANNDLHAFFIKDQETIALLDQFHEGTADLWNDDVSARGTGLPSGKGSELLAALVEREQAKSPDTQVLLTVKNKMPVDVSVRFRKFVSRLSAHMKLSEHDCNLIADAGEIHNLARFRPPDHGLRASRNRSDAHARLVRLLNEQPAIVGILRTMYGTLGKSTGRSRTLDTVGANILTIADLFSDRFRPHEHLSRRFIKTVSGELGRLIDKLFLREVVEAFVALLEADLPAHATEEKQNRVMIYTDLMEHIYPLEARLRNEGFQVSTTDSLEACVLLSKRQQPDMVVLRAHAQPQVVIKTIHYLLSKGVDLTGTPCFLLVKSSNINRLTGLLSMGIEDILDLEGHLDRLIVKIKKARARLEETSKQAQGGSGSTGNLRDMNLIDLLQAMGPSQRTARVTIRQDDEAADALLMYLDRGNVIYAQLGDTEGEKAIHQALGWDQGTWAIEQVSGDDLPEPNNELSNESILMEGCRLLDESKR